MPYLKAIIQYKGDLKEKMENVYTVCSYNVAAMLDFDYEISRKQNQDVFSYRCSRSKIMK